MTRSEFDGQMRRLLGLKFVPATMDTHWDGLRDLPVEALVDAVARATRQCIDFPTPSELRTLADTAGRTVVPAEDRSVALDVPRIVAASFLSKPIAVTREWRYYCEDCTDSGWESLWCGKPGPTKKPWQLSAPCERVADHDPHEWVKECRCVPTNHAIQTKRQASAKYAAVRTERKAS